MINRSSRLSWLRERERRRQGGKKGSHPPPTSNPSNPGCISRHLFLRLIYSIYFLKPLISFLLPSHLLYSILGAATIFPPLLFPVLAFLYSNSSCTPPPLHYPASLPSPSIYLYFILSLFDPTSCFSLPHLLVLSLSVLLLFPAALSSAAARFMSALHHSLASCLSALSFLLTLILSSPLLSLYGACSFAGARLLSSCDTTSSLPPITSCSFFLPAA